MMVYLAGLQQVPKDLHEAAAIDGAGPWQRFVRVTLPMLSPVILFNVIMAVIGSFQVFTQAFVMTGGTPGDLTRFYVLYLYNKAFESYEMGYASAMAWVLLAIVLVLTGVNSTTRARLVAGRVPFIVPGSQLFLPTLFVDLRERMTRPAPRRTETLGNVAQLVVLAHLQGEKMDQRSLAQAANRLGYSPMMLTKAKDELVAAGLCRARYEGRTLRLVFDVDGRELWNKAFPVLSSPVIRTHFVKFVSKVRASDPPVGFVRAGLTAVGDLTELAEGRVPTFAASKTVFASKSRSFVSVEFEDDADARVEVWRHSPDVLGRGGCADPLSLYLSLHGTADERLRKALDDVLKTVRW